MIKYVALVLIFYLMYESRKVAIESLRVLERLIKNKNPFLIGVAIALMVAFAVLFCNGLHEIVTRILIWVFLCLHLYIRSLRRKATSLFF